MERYMITLLLLVFVHCSLAVAHAQTPRTSWTPEEMNPLESAQGRHDKKVEDISCGTGCKFDLHYFRGKNVPGGPNILFISGGPGQLMERVLKPGHQRFLDFLEDKYNVFYFDIRGAGFSAIPGPNKFDTALRAAHVVEDIERIRMAELTDPDTKKIGAWNAVYGHSYGTIVAQRYAKSSPSASPRLKKLILSAPLSRLEDFETDRIEMLVKNFKSILENYRQQTAGQQCPPGAPPTPLSFGEAGALPIGTDNFCFATIGSDGMVDKYSIELKRILTDLTKEFGSVGFVTEYFDQIRDLEENRVKFPSQFPYPKDFYLALKGLAFFGGTEHPPLEAEDFVHNARVNSAFTLGYFLALNKEAFKPDPNINPDASTLPCRPEAPFFEGVTNPAKLAWREKLCERYSHAHLMLTKSENSALDSKRANTVYGLNDGITRSILTIINVQPTPNGCVDSRIVKDFADDTHATTHKTERAVARRVGIDLTMPICLWNPDEHVHDIPTLLLKGSADPFISNCQAERVFTNALTGERILFDFPGVGHLMKLPNFRAPDVKIDGEKALATLIDTFLKKSPEEFSKDGSVKKLREQFGATMHTATGPGGPDICPH
jgi:pimeloyl-ACP methyl ester carboxylesterase